MSSTLTRFRKKGGFMQLVQLIETCEPGKKENLIHLIASEDPGWAHLVRSKTLSVERILDWPQEILMEILPKLPPSITATLMLSTTDYIREKLEKCIPRSQVLEIREAQDRLRVTAGEKFAASVKLFHVVREMETRGEINFATLDPLLMVDSRLVA